MPVTYAIASFTARIYDIAKRWKLGYGFGRKS